MSRDKEKRYSVYSDSESDDTDESAEDQDAVRIELSTYHLLVPEGGEAQFNVRLSSRPSDQRVEVRIKKMTGDGDITVASGASLTFNRRNYNQWRTISLAAAEDDDGVNGQAVFRLQGSDLMPAEVTAEEVENDAAHSGFEILVDRTAINIAEGGSAAFKVKLSADPGRPVAVTTGHADGDADISVTSGGTCYFDSTTWQTEQPVTLSAAEDGDFENGQATFILSAEGASAVNVTAVEQDNDGTAASGRVVVDPISRIEGHLRIEVEITGGEVTKAWSTATLFRGIETILSGRDPLDAPLITQRVCGVCTYVHNLCSVRAIEDALGVVIPDNARDVRNLILGAQFLHDHLVHFYHLHGLDWADITSALTADPEATRRLAETVSPQADAIDFEAVKSRLQGLVDTGNLGPFANAYWGHPAYQLASEENLLIASHYLSALNKQVTAAKMMAILGGKNPHPQSTVVGGVTCGGELSPERLSTFRGYLEEILHFVKTVYFPDLKLVASKYPQWTGKGGFMNFMACGEFPTGPLVPRDLFMPRGMILNGDLFNVQPLDQEMITEHVARSWYEGSTDRHPFSGETAPRYTGLDTQGRYSWLKAPRYDGNAVEVGPLARILVGYGLDRPVFVTAVQNFLSDTGLGEADLFSTLGRTAARAIETTVIGDGMSAWLNALENRLSTGERQIFADHVMDSGSGIGFLEAPRGALGHWISIDGSSIEHYQMVVPTTWNLGPRCADNVPGPLEQALIGTPVADPANPLEVLRVVHAFDPCVACGVHVVDKDKEKTFAIRVL